MMEPPKSLDSLDARSRDIFREIVEAYLTTGEAVGSRTLSQTGSLHLSPASIRNTMADLAQMGLLTARHASAGRLPTHAGLRLFLDGFLEIGDLPETERKEIEARVRAGGGSVEGVLEEASMLLSGLAGGAGLVTTPARDAALRHVEFVPVSPDRLLAVLVLEDGSVENRLMRPPPGVTQSAIVEAGNYLSARLKGRTLAEAHKAVAEELSQGRAALDEAAQRLVQDGVADWTGEGERRLLIVRGHARLLESMQAAEDLERVRLLFEDLERKEELISLLDRARDAEGVRIFIGSENPLFSLSGSSVIVAPYMNQEQRVIGALGVIGPTRLNYARIIPMIDYTARIVGELLDRK